MSIIQHIKEYFTGELEEPKLKPKVFPIPSSPKTQDQIETEKLVEQLKNVSEPTFMLAKAIDDGVVKVYYKPMTVDGYSRQYRISLLFPDKKVIKGWISESYYHSKGGIVFLPSFNREESAYLFTPVLKAIERNISIKEAKEKAKQDEANAKIRNQIVQSLS